MDWIPGYPWPEWPARIGSGLMLIAIFATLKPLMDKADRNLRGDDKEK